MKCVILAGGKGTRISEISKNIPKPMINLLGKPIILRIMEHYSKYGVKDFIIASGYKSKIIKNFFKKKIIKDWKVNVVETGLNTMTGGRLKKLKNLLKNETFFMTYGDGLCDVNLRKLLKFHLKNKKIATITAVRPPARFGALKITKKKVVTYFKEKSSLDEGWINGGFFVLESKIFRFIKNDQTFFEKEPLQKLSKLKSLYAYKHYGFWQCMDTMRDKLILEKKLRNL